MADKELVVNNPIPKKFSLFRLLVDQARIDDDIKNYHYPGAGTVEDPYVVSFIPNDAGNPFNWSKVLRWTITATVATELFATAFSSSAFSGTMRELTAHFHASAELMTAGISLFVLGFAVGPLLWAPLSEIFGRQIIFATTFAAFAAFSAACTADNGVATLLVMRFFSGAFGASPLTNAGGVIADIFPANERGLAMAFFALAPSMGPTMGPFIAGFLGENEGWRWVMGVIAIFVGIMWILGVLVVPETYAPAILRKRAAKLSQMTGKVYKTKVEIEKGEVSAAHVLKVALVRPWILLFVEPIVLILSIYMAIIYGTLYLLFGAFPQVFQVSRGWSEGVGGLAFLGVAVGMFAAVIFQGVANKWYVKAAEKNGGIAPPEARLVGCMVGAILIPIGLFWFAWTNYPSIFWFSAVAAGAPFGFGFTLVFLGITNYLIDAYTIFAASVLAANTVLRSLFGAAFPLFTDAMYENLGIHWASSIPGFLAVACVPAPFILYKYGATIRSKCVYAAEAEKAMMIMMERSKAAEKAASGEDLPGQLSSSVSSDTTAADLREEKEEEGRFGPIRSTPMRTRTRNNSSAAQSLRNIRTASSMADAVSYNANPFDIDRVMTHDSLAGLDLKQTRTNRSQGK